MHGKFFRESGSGGVFIAGRPIIDAHQFERAQNWIGISLSPSVIQTTHQLDKTCKIARCHKDTGVSELDRCLPWMLSVQRYGAIPFHTHDPVAPAIWDGFAIVPTEYPKTDACAFQSFSHFPGRAGRGLFSFRRPLLCPVELRRKPGSRNLYPGGVIRWRRTHQRSL